MSSNVQQYVPFKKESASVTTQKVINDTIKLLGENKTILSLGDSTHEGGNVEIFRDGSNNLALFFDADAASNAKALDVYGGVVFQNHLTVGSSTLNTSSPLYVYGNVKNTGYFHVGSNILVSNGLGFRAVNNNQTSLIAGNIIVSGTDATDHSIISQIGGNNILEIKATGDGAGGIVDLKVVIKHQLVYTPSSDTAITAAGGITVTKAIMRIAGNGGAIDITANPQIAAGTDGQVVIIQGTHDTNTVTLDDGTGLALSAQCVLAAQDNITLMYDSGDSEWIETSRTTVV